MSDLPNERPMFNGTIVDQEYTTKRVTQIGEVYTIIPERLDALLRSTPQSKEVAAHTMEYNPYYVIIPYLNDMPVYQTPEEGIPPLYVPILMRYIHFIDTQDPDSTLVRVGYDPVGETLYFYYPDGKRNG